MRAALKRVVETCLVHSGAPTVGRRLMRGRTLVLAYHDITPDGAPPWGDASLHLPRARFAEQLDRLVERHRVVPLSSVLAGDAELDAEGDARPRVAITFDDAYRGALEHGLPELVRRGLPATIFVAPGLLGATTWWDELAGSARGLDAATRRRALEELRGDGDAIRRSIGDGATLGRIPEWGRIATEAELREAVGPATIRLGAHGWSHPNLAAQPTDDLIRELARPLAWLGERFPDRAIPWLAYPYGCTSPSVEVAAAAAGYAGACRVEGGWVPLVHRAPHSLPRLNVAAGLSTRGFTLRLAGLR